MPRLLRVAAATACVTLALTWLVRAQVPTSPSSPVTQLQSALSLAFLSAVPPPADDPLLDSSGNIVLDASGNPVSDPNEAFHQVKPADFDPAHTFLVEAGWIDGTGCPTAGFIAVPNGTFTGVAGTAPYSDSACPTGDSKDQHNAGLLLTKTGPTGNFASATAELKKVRGITLTELGYDLRKPATTLDPRGSHCGAGAPRFDVITSDGVDHFIGCNSPPPEQMASTTGWIRLRWGAAELAAAFPPLSGSDVVSRIVIVFDEGQDTGPDNFGTAILDNIDVNGMLVGRGPEN